MTDIIYIHEAAKMLGKSTDALRAMLQRGSANTPPAFKVGRKWAMQRSAVKNWIKVQSK